MITRYCSILINRQMLFGCMKAMSIVDTISIFLQCCHYDKLRDINLTSQSQQNVISSINENGKQIIFKPNRCNSDSFLTTVVFRNIILHILILRFSIFLVICGSYFVRNKNIDFLTKVNRYCVNRKFFVDNDKLTRQK